MKIFEGLNPVTIRDFIEYTYHAGVWAKNRESESRIKKLNSLMEKNEELRSFISEKCIKEKYETLWAGSRWKLNEDKHYPKVGDIIRREDNSYHVWSQRKSVAIKNSGFNEAVNKPQLGGSIVISKEPILKDQVIVDFNGLGHFLNSIRERPKELKKELINALQEDYDKDYMYRIFNSMVRVNKIKNNFEVITTNECDLARVVADFSHNKGLLEANGVWRTNKKTEIL